MTNPLQIQTPQIGPTAVVPAHNAFASGFELVTLALQKRQELQQAREDLARKREEFELHRKIAGTQLAGMELDNEKKKRDFKTQEEDLAAQDQALQLYTGNLPQLHDARGIGEVIARVKDPKVAAHFYSLLQQGAQAQNAATPTYQFQQAGTPTGGTEIVGFDPKNPTQTVGTGRPGPPDAASRRIPVITEREKASAAVGAIRANAIVNRLEAADPTIGARVAGKVAVRKSIIQGIVRRVTGTSPEEANFLAEAEIEKSMTPDELEYYVGAKQWMGAVLPGLAGKQVTGREFMIQAPAFFSLGSGNPKVVGNRLAARTSRTRGFITEAGDAMTERLPELQDVDLSPYGLGTVVLPDNTQHVITPGKAKYHPRFRP